jgi:hypothetical protein
MHFSAPCSKIFFEELEPFRKIIFIPKAQTPRFKNMWDYDQRLGTNRREERDRGERTLRQQAGNERRNMKNSEN